VSSSEKTTRTHLIKRQLEVLSPQAGLRQAIGLTETAMNNYDLVILDIMAPGNEWPGSMPPHPGQNELHTDLDPDRATHGIRSGGA